MWDGVYGEYMEYREVLVDTILMCGISPMEANMMLDNFEVLVIKTKELAKGGDPKSNVMKVGES